jgi:hypothetical protein
LTQVGSTRLEALEDVLTTLTTSNKDDGSSRG